MAHDDCAGTVQQAWQRRNRLPQAQACVKSESQIRCRVTFGKDLAAYDIDVPVGRQPHLFMLSLAGTRAKSQLFRHLDFLTESAKVQKCKLRTDELNHCCMPSTV